MRGFNRIKRKLNQNKYNLITVIFVSLYITLFLSIIAVGLFGDGYMRTISVLWQEKGNGLLEKLSQYNSQNADGILNVLSLIWTVTSGLIFFGVQCGYGKRMGLEMIDILNLLMNNCVVFFLSFVISAKLLIYLYTYLFEAKYMLFWAPIEGIFSLAVICIFIVLITDNTIIVKIMKEYIRKSFANLAKGKKKNFCSVLIKMVKGVNYTDSVEVEGLSECVAVYFKNMDSIEQYKTMGVLLEDDKNTILQQLKISEQIVSDIYISTQESKQILFFVQMIVKQIEKEFMENAGNNAERNVKLFLLMKNLLQKTPEMFTAEDIKKMLIVIEDSVSVIRYIICFLECRKGKTVRDDYITILMKELMRDVDIPQDMIPEIRETVMTIEALYEE